VYSGIDIIYRRLPGSWKRYKRVQDTTVEYYIYDGPNVVASYASNGDLNARYVTPGLDENLSVTRGGNTYYYMTDGLGSVRNVVESDEDTANTYDYYAFGDSLGTQTQGVTNPFRYTAREYESGSVLDAYYYRNRYYLSALGIFASRDAVRADGHRGWGYVQAAPTLFADPFGRSVITTITVVTGAGGGATAQFGLVVDWDSINFLSSVGGGPNLNAGGSVSISVGYFPGSAQNLLGLGLSNGGSIGPVSGDWNLNDKGSGWDFGLGWPFGLLPFECHDFVTETTVIPIAKNPCKACEEFLEEVLDSWRDLMDMIDRLQESFNPNERDPNEGDGKEQKDLPWPLSNH
jgi:RHS repeat-associated protein